ncbi:unnamed protein product [Durusdinium trenchii]|uniref:Peptidyl-prolyl cis-trans isomerase E n=2 Tax=Durusdinium trenchii TaxID=1381693 RepID=A0ABP0RL02_9DINO
MARSNFGKCQALLTIAAAAWVLSSWLAESFVGVGQSQREPNLSGRRISVTGQSKEILRDSDEWKESSMNRWWWQREGFFTPRGYRGNPNWNIEDYKIACQEGRLNCVEQMLIKELKGRGMTIEEIRQKASVYEFVEGPNQPKLTKRMQFLLQVKYLYEGRDGELVDLAEEIEKSPPSFSYSGEPGADIFRDWDWEGIAR